MDFSVGTLIAIPLLIVGDNERSYTAVSIDDKDTLIFIVKKYLCECSKNIINLDIGQCIVLNKSKQRVDPYFADVKVGDKVWAIGDEEDGYIKKIYEDDEGGYPLRVDYNGYNSIMYNKNGEFYGKQEQSLFYAHDPRVKKLKELQVRMKNETREIIN